MIINFSDDPIVKSSKSIFLAGPTLRNSNFEKSWRKMACDILNKLGFDGVVYVPEFGKSDNPMNFLNQASWEREGLQEASVIIFYIPRKLPELPGFTTNVEFGMWLSKKPNQTLLCCPEGSEKNRYLIWLYKQEKPNSEVFTNLLEILNEAVKIEAAKIILIHNHPAGDPTPSNQDIEFTNKVEQASKILGIQLLDHIVIGRINYVSIFNEREKMLK